MGDLSIKVIDSLQSLPIAGHKAEKFSDALELVACRNEYVSGAMLIEADAESEVEATYRGTGTVAILRAESVPVRERNHRIADPLIEGAKFAVSGTQAVQLRLFVPKDAEPGLHVGRLTVTSGSDRAEMEVRLRVKETVLPDLWSGKFFLNIWMNPGAIAAWYGVPLWSEEYWARLEPYVADLAVHGQKTVVVPIVFDPWCSQTYTPYPSTVEWIKEESGWRMDFSVFDRYVELHAKYGITQAIHCYSPVHSPGNSNKSTVLYRDTDGEEKKLTAEVDTDEYREVWGAFFRRLVEHLKAKSWLDKTYMSFDEKPGEVMATVFGLLKDLAPDLKISLAADRPQELYNELDDVSLIITLDEGGLEAVRARRKAGKLTTFYVCCGPAYPNTFVFSPLVESRMLPWIAWERGFDGFLRWAYNDWTADPFEHPEWGEWGTGDCFFVYPGENGAVTTARWEMLREGIQEFELLSILQDRISLLSADLAESYLAKLNEAVALAARNPDGNGKDLEDMRSARWAIFDLLDQVEAELKEGGQ